jgi:predicted DNA-binding transcriptional regulator AlpA
MEQSRLSLKVSEFCQQTGISKSTLYGAWRDGDGPKTFRVRGRVLISSEAASDWIRNREEAEAAKDAQESLDSPVSSQKAATPSSAERVAADIAPVPLSARPGSIGLEELKNMAPRSASPRRSDVASNYNRPNAVGFRRPRPF